MIEATGAGIVPPYSPELNPIEFVWAKVFSKKLLNTEVLYQTIAKDLDMITPNDAKNCFSHYL